MAPFRTLLCLVPIALMAACSMQEEVDIDLPGHTPVTLVECYLEPGQPARALATKSLGYFDDLEAAAENGLQISLHSGGRSINLVNRLVVDSVRRVSYNYYSEDTISYQEGVSWEMIVWNNEKEIARGTASFLPRPVFRKIDYALDAEGKVSLELEVEDNPATEDFYRVMLHLEGSPPWGHFDGLWTDANAAGGVLKITTGHQVEMFGDRLFVSVYRLDKNHYEFIESLKKAYDANYNPFAQPANLESNLVGESTGVFTAISLTRDTLQIRR
ncbi:DUF4249 family protein [Cesiribacter sp. SM1]|uniref:DUF4249 family protein n=1 Tax=Cesiribacter sp. SM1 TaxID=2861196 RepID=UPI001CD2A0DB|nr:DUF4249 family protein [Cesiribacter sp. SM1]